MEFRLDEEQLDLQAAVDALCRGRFPFEEVREHAEESLDRARWRDLADLGVFSLSAPGAAPGDGLGAFEAALVVERLAYHLVPGPLVWTALAAGHIAGADSGDMIVTGVDGDRVVDGSASVPFAGDADAVMVLDRNRVSLHHRAELGEVVPLQPIDPTTPFARVSGLHAGATIGDATTAQMLRTLGTVLVAAGLAGLADRALEVARAYALERHQFGVPIGSFQAVKHLLADGYVRANLAQASVHAAATLFDDPDTTDRATAASAAKLVAADAARQNAAMAVQVLGGMGFTWDMPPNFLVKRAWVLADCLGAPSGHATTVGNAFIGAGR